MISMGQEKGDTQKVSHILKLWYSKKISMAKMKGDVVRCM